MSETNLVERAQEHTASGFSGAESVLVTFLEAEGAPLPALQTCSPYRIGDEL